MYLPSHFEMTDAEALQSLRSARTGHLVTSGGGNLSSTFIPFLVDDTGSRVIAHIARANPQRREIGKGTRGLLIVHGPDSYVSPSLYPSKEVTGEVVPTWAYTEIQVRGHLELVRDLDEIRAIVARLTERMESESETPWSIDDAPAEFTSRLLRSIVGVSMAIDSIEGKAKLNQDDEPADREAVAESFMSSDGTRAQLGRLMRDAR